MVHIIFALILISRWQSVMRGRYSETLSSVLLMIAVILIIVGLIIKSFTLLILLFLVYFLIEDMILGKILFFATYAPKGFLPSVLIVILFGSLVPYFITILNLSDYLIWFVILTLGSGTLGLSQQLKEGKLIYSRTSIDNSGEDIETVFKKKKRKYLIVFSIYIFSIIVFVFLSKGGII